MALTAMSGGSEVTPPKMVAEGNVGRIAAGAEADEAHRNGCSRGVEKIPSAAEENLDIGVEIGRAECRVGAVVDAGRKARRNAQGAADGDHQVGKVAANADAVGQRIERRGGRSCWCCHGK